MKPYEYIRQADACLMYYAKIDPDSLTDEEWARKIKELEWVRNEEARQNR